VFAKRGRQEIVGHGIVTGEYRYDKNRGEYPNTRTVDWRGRGSWKPREKALVTKTLTDVGKYPQLVSDLKSAVGLSAGAGPEVEPPTSTVAIYTIDQACDDLFAEGALIEQAVELLKHKKNLVLQGPPGVGKTYFAKCVFRTIVSTHSDST